jgi:hypothetical protein
VLGDLAAKAALVLDNARQEGLSVRTEHLRTEDPSFGNARIDDRSCGALGAGNLAHAKTSNCVQTRPFAMLYIVV